jgi:tetratricopeptide (TPR) repeat protein
MHPSADNSPAGSPVSIRVAGAVCAMLLLALPCLADVLEPARRLIDSGDYSAARRALEPALENRQTEAEASLLLATTSNALQDYDNGIRHGRRAIGLLPESAEAHYRYAEALRIKMSRVNKLRALFSVSAYKDAFRRAIELDPRHVLARREEIGYLTYAPSIAGGDTAQARRRVEELMAIDWHTGMMCRAQLEAREENFETALTVYAELLSRHPADGECGMELALLLDQLGRSEEAEREISRIVRTADAALAASGLHLRARSRTRGPYQPQQAAALLLRFIDALADAAEQIPARSAAYWRLGNAYRHQGRPEAAREAYEQALELDPDNAEASRALRALPAS